MTQVASVSIEAAAQAIVARFDNSLIEVSCFICGEHHEVNRNGPVRRHRCPNCGGQMVAGLADTSLARAGGTAAKVNLGRTMPRRPTLSALERDYS